MISAVTEACSVRYAEVDRKIYKFQSLVFKEDLVENHVQPRKAFTENCRQQELEKRADKPRGILSSRQSSVWRRAYGEYLHQMKERKGSETRLPQCQSALPGTKRAKTEKRVVFLDTDESVDEPPSCPTNNLIMEKCCEDFNRLMDQPKEDLVIMLVKLKQQLALKNIAHRKNGYCPTEDELKQLQEGSQNGGVIVIEQADKISRQTTKPRAWKKYRRSHSLS